MIDTVVMSKIVRDEGVTNILYNLIGVLDTIVPKEEYLEKLKIDLEFALDNYLNRYSTMKCLMCRKKMKMAELGYGGGEKMSVNVDNGGDADVHFHYGSRHDTKSAKGFVCDNCYEANKDLFVNEVNGLDVMMRRHRGEKVDIPEEPLKYGDVPPEEKEPEKKTNVQIVTKCKDCNGGVMEDCKDLGVQARCLTCGGTQKVVP